MGANHARRPVVEDERGVLVRLDRVAHALLLRLEAVQDSLLLPFAHQNHSVTRALAARAAHALDHANGRGWRDMSMMY